MNNHKAFTLIELLIVLAIIALLVGILLPSITMVRRQAQETAQKAQFAAIDMALDAFKQDYGDYPPSNYNDGFFGDPAVYCGAQKLTEALLGWDLQGFHPQTAWRRDGFDASGGNTTYDPFRTRPITPQGPPTLLERRGPYLEVAKTNVFRLNISTAGANDGLYIPANIPFFTNFFDKSLPNFVICDVFGVKKISIVTTLPPPTGGIVTTTKMAGSPILYYKANTTSKIFLGSNPNNSIYNYADNIHLLLLGKLPDGYNGSPDRIHTLAGGMPSGIYFYNPAYKIVDENIYSATNPHQLWPHRPDTYILISAGADHEFGTKDDILNF
jgi:prepilin-type N-terminal cleavage/methylation domain-containing protein